MTDAELDAPLTWAGAHRRYLNANKYETTRSAPGAFNTDLFIMLASFPHTLHDMHKENRHDA